jgi:hypothetical protein
MATNRHTCAETQHRKSGVPTVFGVQCRSVAPLRLLFDLAGKIIDLAGNLRYPLRDGRSTIFKAWYRERTPQACFSMNESSNLRPTHLEFHLSLPQQLGYGTTGPESVE